jgi:hypothetical protein
MPKKDRNLELMKDVPATAPKIRELTLTDRQLALLLDADRTLGLAQERMNLVFTGICAAAGIDNARIAGLEGKKLTVAILDAP